VLNEEIEEKNIEEKKDYDSAIRVLKTNIKILNKLLISVNENLTLLDKN
jgi:prefoldin subunit 5